MSSGIYNRRTGYHNRRSIRLRGYDYSQPGRYFITICIHNRKRRLFGDIVGGKMVFNEFGNIAYNEFVCLPDRFPIMKLDYFQIMPNHVHAVIPIGRVTPVGASLAGAPSCGSDGQPDGKPDGKPDNQTHDPAQTLTGAITPHRENRLSNTRGYDSECRHFGLVPSDSVPGGRCVCGLDGDGVNGSNGACGTNGSNGTNGTGASPAPTGMGTGNTVAVKTTTLGDIVGAYKSLVANECLKIHNSRNERMGKLWQRNYYDHIVRDDTSLFFVRQYIQENPLHWINDMKNHIDNEVDEFDMEEVHGGN